MQKRNRLSFCETSKRYLFPFLFLRQKIGIRQCLLMPRGRIAKVFNGFVNQGRGVWCRWVLLTRRVLVSRDITLRIC